MSLLLPAWAVQAGWVPQESHVPGASFRAVHAASSAVVWVGGTSGACLRTVDGGTNWERLTVPNADNLDFRSVFAFDARTAVLASAGEAGRGLARICRTGDGGQTWQTVFDTAEQGVFLDAVSFWDPASGLAVGDPIDRRWYLLQTTDGGRSWERIAPAGLPLMQFGEAAFAASNSSLFLWGTSNLWIASGSAWTSRVFLSPNRAKTWRVLSTPIASGPTAGIFALCFWDAQHGIAVGGDHQRETNASENVLLTSDGGLHWRKGAPTNPSGLKEGVVILPGNVLLAVGPSGTSLSRNLAQSWQKVDHLRLHGLSCAQGRCWAVGDQGLIVRWRED